MKILLLGANGMLGRAVQQVFCFEDLIPYTRKEIDLFCYADIVKKITNICPQIVINCAAYTNVDKAESEISQAYWLNADAVKSIATVCHDIKAKLVHISSDFVFGNEFNDKAEQHPHGYKERANPFEPCNTYGRSKLLGEQYLKECGKDYYLIRTSWLFGPFKDNFVTKIINIAKDKTSIRVVLDQWGCPTYTFDLARSMLYLIKNHDPGIYHIVNKGITSRIYFAEEILKQVKYPVRVEGLDADKTKRQRNSILINTKIPELRPWEYALEDYLLGLDLI